MGKAQLCIRTSYPYFRPILNRGMIEWEDAINMILCIIIQAAAAWLVINNNRFMQEILAEFFARLLTTIFFLQVYTWSIYSLYPQA